MKIGIIRCQSYSDNCPAAGCLGAVRNLSGQFEEYDEVELIGLDTCGGCNRGSSEKVAKKAERMKDLGAEAIHLGNCLVGPCPYKEIFTEGIEDVGLKAVDGTH